MSDNTPTVTNRKKATLLEHDDNGYESADNKHTAAYEVFDYLNHDNNSTTNNNNINVDINNNNSNFKHAEEFITDEGLKTNRWPSFVNELHAFMITTGLHRKGRQTTVTIVFVVFIILIYLFSYVISPLLFSSITTTTTVDEDVVNEPIQVIPADNAVIVDFSDEQLKGVTSGRLNQWFFEMKLHTSNLLAKNNVVCATPWLDFPLKQQQTFYNMLVIKDRKTEEEQMFVNVRDVTVNKDKGSSLTTTVPIKFKSNKSSRFYYNELTFTHSKGSYTTTTLEEAFCIQELY